MSFHSVLHRGCVFLVRWQAPSVADVELVVAEVHAAARAYGRPILTLWIAPEGLPAPRGDVRDAMSRAMPALLRDCEVHNVLEGSTFKTRILRSIITNLFQVSRIGERMFVYRSVEEALLALTPKLRRYDVDIAALCAESLRAGVLRPDVPTEGPSAPIAL